MSSDAGRLALLDTDAQHAQRLARELRAQGWRVAWFRDGDDFLVSKAPYGFGFYLVDLSLAGVEGARLVRLLRRRSNAGVVAMSEPRERSLRTALEAGADMYLPKPLAPEDAALAVRAVLRRTGDAARRRVWQLDPRSRQLFTPAGETVPLSETDVQVLGCFLGDGGAAVSAEALCAALGRPAAPQADNGLHATVYRLRRRVQRVSDEALPLQSQAGAGYVFRSPLSLR
jgi:DNA-binding response OmpR family regulator